MLGVRMESARRWKIVVIAAVVLLAADRLAPAQDAATQPSAGLDATSQPVARTAEVVVAELRANHEKLHDAIGDSKALGDEAVRKAVAPKAIPILKQMVAEFDEFGALLPEAKAEAQASQDQSLAFLSILGDADATAKLTEMAASKDPEVALRGQNSQLFGQWIAAGKDGAAQGKIADSLIALDKAHPDNIDLTTLTYMFSESSVSPALKKQLETTVTDTMKNDAATQFKEEIAADQKLKLTENKDLVIVGKQVDGKAFTTADWKGKVILVDFWATWCAPCIADLPRLKKAYADYHKKGFEILGVSNDKDLQTLKDFLAKDDKMTWPELFDEKAANANQWNSITDGLGINRIPHIFLIDKKGVLRTVDGEDNLEDMVPKLLAE